MNEGPRRGRGIGHCQMTRLLLCAPQILSSSTTWTEHSQVCRPLQPPRLLVSTCLYTSFGYVSNVGSASICVIHIVSINILCNRKNWSRKSNLGALRGIQSERSVRCKACCLRLCLCCVCLCQCECNTRMPRKISVIQHRPNCERCVSEFMLLFCLPFQRFNKSRGRSVI